jgi:hypothetical protein
LNRQLNVVSLFSCRKILELRQTRMRHLRVVASFAETPAGLDLGYGPHLVDVFGQFVANVFDEGGKLDLQETYYLVLSAALSLYK